MQAIVRWTEGLTFLAKANSSHWVVMDTSKASGGSDGAPTPMEMVLFALGGCTGMDVVSILEKMRVPFKKFEIVLDADRSDTHPKVFTQIRLEYRIYGDQIDPEKVQKAIALSQEKYCSVAGMLKSSVPITATYSIFPLEEEKENAS